MRVDCPLVLAGGKPYMVTVRMPASDSAVLYGGWPWNYKVHLRPFQCGINQGEGVGVAHFWYRYEDDCPVTVPKPSSLLLEPLISDHPLVVRLFQNVNCFFLLTRECQSSDIVGGKGSSLALLSTLRDQHSVTKCYITLVSAPSERTHVREHTQQVFWNTDPCYFVDLSSPEYLGKPPLPFPGLWWKRSAMLASQEVVRKSSSDIPMVSWIIDPKLPSEHLMEELVPLGVSTHYVGTTGNGLSATIRQKVQVLVPPGLCLTVAAFQTQLEECSQLQKEITTLEQIVQGKLSGDLKQQCEKYAL
uniref:Uncharacterized protein n=1 Tax=Timema shepardi TaxID=629360 RepID=A0A7R9B7I8_TIMSH|nr:unnamed protein product [Timema shepardi]